MKREWQARPADLTVWEKVLWALRDPWTNQYWLQLREARHSHGG